VSRNVVGFGVLRSPDQAPSLIDDPRDSFQTDAQLDVGVQDVRTKNQVEDRIGILSRLRQYALFAILDHRPVPDGALETRREFSHGVRFKVPGPPLGCRVGAGSRLIQKSGRADRQQDETDSSSKSASQTSPSPICEQGLLLHGSQLESGQRPQRQRTAERGTRFSKTNDLTTLRFCLPRCAWAMKLLRSKINNTYRSEILLPQDSSC
jgi:hypothetical protein